MLQKLTNFIFPKFSAFRPINYNESLKILNSNGNDFMERYKVLMKINHPDRDGSPFICMKINEAKNFLLEHKKNISDF